MQRNNLDKRIDSYGNSVSFFFEPIPLDLPQLFFNKNPMWVSGETLYQHEIELYTLEPDILYHIVETPRKTELLYEVQDWSKVKSQPKLKDLYFNQVEKMEVRYGYRGKGVKKMLFVIRRDRLATGIRYRFNEAVNIIEKHNEWETNGTKYAAMVPHVMLYPTTPIKVHNVTPIKLL